MTSREKDAPVLPFAQSAAPPDALRAMLRQLVHDVIEAGFDRGRVRRRRPVRADARAPAGRRDVRNGHRTRRRTTRVGALELRVPRDRAGQVQPSLVARRTAAGYQRRAQALVAALAGMYVQGGARGR